MTATTQGDLEPPRGGVDPREAAEEQRLESLLAGQRDVFEQIARGAKLGDVLNRLIWLIEGHFATGAMASVLLLDEDGERLLHGAAPSLPDDYNAAIDGVEIGPEVGSCGRAAFLGESVVTADISQDPCWAEWRDLAEAAGLRACWSVPVKGADGRTLGAFAVYQPYPGEPSEGDQAVLEAFVQTTAVAIERDRDTRAMEREKTNTEVLHRVGQAISARLDLDEIVQLVTDSATAVTRAQFGAFFYNVLDEHGAAFQLYMLSGAPRHAFERFPMPRATGIFAPTFNGEDPVRLKDVTVDPRHGKNPPFNGMPRGHLPVHSYLAVPVIMSDGEVVGGLFFGHSEVGVFDAEAERLAVGIAAQAAIALENARLFEAAQREIERRKQAFAERDRVARTLEASLLPRELPHIPHIELAARYQAFSEDISGDFYDAFPLSDGRWGLVVGDVCGKGAEAAALTGLARYTVRTAAVLDPRPAHVLGVLNSALLESDETARFCTAVFAVLTPEEEGVSVTIAHGGHPPALHVHEGGVREVEATGLLLGAYADAPVGDTTIQLAPGDALVMYTDGLTDVSVDGEVLGDGWLADEISNCHGAGADAIAGQLDDGAAARQGDGVGRDDIALLVVSATGTN